MASLLLGYEAKVKNLVCDTINGAPASARVSSIIIDAITLTPSSKVVNIRGIAKNVTNPVDVYVNTASTQPSTPEYTIQSPGLLDQVFGLNVTMQTTFAAGATYYFFLKEQNNGLGYATFTVTCPAAQTASITNVVVQNVIYGGNSFNISATLANIPSNTSIQVTYNVGTAASGTGQSNITIIQASDLVSGRTLTLPSTTTFDPLPNNQKYWFYLTNMSNTSITANAGIVPQPASITQSYSISANTVQVQPIAATNRVYVQATNTIPNGSVIVVSVATSSTSFANAVPIGRISNTQLTTGFTLAAGNVSTFNNGTSYTFFFDCTTPLGAIVQASKTINLTSVANSLTVTQVKMYSLQDTVLNTTTLSQLQLMGTYTGNFLGIATLVDVYMNAANSVVGGTKVGSTTLVQLNGNTNIVLNPVGYNMSTVQNGVQYYVYLKEPSTSVTSAVFAVSPFYLNLRIMPLQLNAGSPVYSLVILGENNLPTSSSVRFFVNNNIVTPFSLFGQLFASEVSRGKTLACQAQPSENIIQANTLTFLSARVDGVSIYNMSFTPLVAPSKVPNLQDVMNALSGSGSFSSIVQTAVVSASSFDGGNFALNVFDGNSVSQWRSKPGAYTNTLPNATAAQTTANSITYKGEYITIQTPSQCWLSYFTVKFPMLGNGRPISTNLVVLGSQDGSTWIPISSVSEDVGMLEPNVQTVYQFILTAIAPYSYYRFIVPNCQNAQAEINDISLYTYSSTYTSSGTSSLPPNVFRTLPLTSSIQSNAISSMTINATPLGFNQVVLTALNVSTTALPTEIVVVYGNDPNSTIATPTVAQLKAGFTISGLYANTIYNWSFDAKNYSGAVQQFTTPAN